jgi:hypothetical protein
MSFAIDMSRSNLCFALCLLEYLHRTKKIKKKTLKKNNVSYFTQNEKGKKRLQGKNYLLRQMLLL